MESEVEWPVPQPSLSQLADFKACREMTQQSACSTFVEVATTEMSDNSEDNLQFNQQSKSSHWSPKIYTPPEEAKLCMSTSPLCKHATRPRKVALEALQSEILSWCKDLKISSPSLRYVDDHIPTKVTSASAFSHSHKLKKFITRTPFSQKQQYELKFPANKYSKEHEIEIKAGPKYPEIDNCLLAPFPCNHPEFPRITDIHQAQTERRQSIPSSTQQSKRQCYHDRKDLPADGPIKQHCFDSCTSQQTQYSQPQLSQLSHDATLKKCCSQENKICDEQPSSPTVGKPQKQSLMIPDQQTNNHQLCTKEEIERKRIKAKILRNKMQAIRKRQAKQRYMKQQLQTCPSRHAHCFHSV